MKSMATFLLFFLSSLSLLSISRAQGRAPHGLAYENPMAFSPSAFDFFHPNAPSPNADTPCIKSECEPLPLSSFSSASAVAEATEAHESKLSTPQASRSQIGAGAVAGIVFGFVFVALLAMGVYYFVITRRANVDRASLVQPDA